MTLMHRLRKVASCELMLRGERSDMPTCCLILVKLLLVVLQPCRVVVVSTPSTNIGLSISTARRLGNATVAVAKQMTAPYVVMTIDRRSRQVLQLSNCLRRAKLRKKKGALVLALADYSSGYRLGSSRIA